MDPIYAHIFDDFYNAQSDREYPDRDRIMRAASFSSDRPVRRVRDIIEKAESGLESEFGLRLRSDARYFLLLNLTEMMVRPIQARTGEPPFERNGELQDMLVGDVRLLVLDAARRHRDHAKVPDREISGHRVVEALAANWSRLRLNSYRIWGER